jgi:hypothetical protein
MTGTYAAGTEVSPGRSRDEIERILTRYGASEFGYAVKSTRAMLGFVASNRQVRFDVPLPDPREFRLTPTGMLRTEKTRQDAYEAEVRRRWRSLALLVKAKLEAVASGIVTFEEEFAMHMVLPDGSKVSDTVVAGIASAYEGREVPALMAGSR